MPTRDPRVDAYIAKAKPFARPILKHIREAVRAGCPGAIETIKWGFPSFYYNGPLCGMAAFKEHATLSFWKASLLADRLPKVDEKAMGQFGHLKAVGSLPGRAQLVRLVKAAAALNDRGVKVERRRATKRPVRTPAFVLAALRKNASALAAYQKFPPSHKREYIEWIADAKQAETRQRRLAQAVAWIAEGKSRNWQYETTRKSSA